MSNYIIAASWGILASLIPKCRTAELHEIAYLNHRGGETKLQCLPKCLH
jgi:hypothetical protein